MKNFYSLTVVGALAAGLFAFKHVNQTSVKNFHDFKSGSGAPVAKTGAPGEGNCTDCHGGSTQDGSSIHVLTILDGSFNAVTEYTPGATYTVGFAQSNNAGGTGGFQGTVLDATNTMAGSFTANAIGETQKLTSGGREYVTHTDNSVPSPSWGWQWTAPATDVGDVTFYFASNDSNGSAVSGDAIYLSQHVISPSSAGINEEVIENKFEAAYASSTDKLILNFSTASAGKMSINIVDMNGRTVLAQNLGQSIEGENHQEIDMPNAIGNGVYIVNFFVDNTPMSAKIMVNK